MKKILALVLMVLLIACCTAAYSETGADIKVIQSNPDLKELVELKTNISFSNQDGKELSMQIAKPQWKPESDRGFPLVVFIQGSAWTNPDQSWEMPQLSLLARRGFVVASVTHRSVLDVPAPAFLQDVKTAIRFLRANAKDYSIDPDRVCAWGTSSGGNIALLLGMTGDDPVYQTEEWSGYSDSVNAVVDCFGPTDIVKLLDEQKEANQEFLVNLITQMIGGDSEENLKLAQSISPISLVEEGKKFPPFLILHGDNDELVSYEGSVALYEKLVNCGYSAEMYRVEGAPHESTFWSMDVFNAIFDFIGEHI